LTDASANEAEVDLLFLDALSKRLLKPGGSVPELPFGALGLGAECYPLLHVRNAKPRPSVNPVSLTPLSCADVLNWPVKAVQSFFLGGLGVENTRHGVAQMQRQMALLPENTPIQGVADLRAL
jgi:hypothetical protein